MKKINKALTDTLNKLHQQQSESGLSPGTFKKTKTGYLIRRKDGSYGAAFTKEEATNKTK